MKVAVVEQFGQVVVREVTPPECGPYEARCELLFGSICAGTDQHLVAGDPPFCNWVQLPVILGHESVGRVVEVGEKVRSFAVGDLVPRVGTKPVDGYGVAWGGFAETGIAFDWQAMRDDGLDASRWSSFRMQQTLPADTDPAAATMFITWRETLSYLRRMGELDGAAVLVIGSGGNGLAFANHARNLGASTITMIGSPRRAARAQRAGVTRFIDYQSDHAKDEAQEAADAAGAGYGFAIDSVGKAGMPDLALSLLKPDGVLGVYGLDDSAAKRLDVTRARGDFRFKSGAYDEAEAHDAVLREFRAGRLDPTIWLEFDEPYPLDRIADALESVRNRERVKPLIQLSE